MCSVIEGVWASTITSVKKMRVFATTKVRLAPAPPFGVSSAEAAEPALQAEDEGKDQDKADAGPYAALGADNQKLNLVAAMLSVDDWASAEALLEALEPALPVAYAPVAQAFCQHIHRFIDTVYRQVQVGYWGGRGGPEVAALTD
jgi:hypothetical protein